MRTREPKERNGPVVCSCALCTLRQPAQRLKGLVAVPHPMPEQRVRDGTHQNREGDKGTETEAFGNRARHDRNRRAAEHQLEDGEDDEVDALAGELRRNGWPDSSIKVQTSLH